METRESDIDTCGMHQTTAVSSSGIDSQAIKNDSKDIRVSNDNGSSDKPLRKSAEGTTVSGKNLSSEDSSASVWWRNELDRLEILVDLENAEKCAYSRDQRRRYSRERAL